MSVPPFMLLKLLSSDDHVGEVLTWRGPVGGRPQLWVRMTMPYDAGLASLPALTRIRVEVDGSKREFALLAVEPAPDATCSGMEIRRRPTEPEPAEADEESAYKFFDTFRATGPLAANIRRLVEHLTLRGNLEDAAHEAAFSKN